MSRPSHRERGHRFGLQCLSLCVWMLVISAGCVPKAGIPKGHPCFGKKQRALTTPTVVKAVAPVYPEQARLNKREAKVTYRVLINTDGHVARLWLVSASAPDFEAMAAEALWKWQFKPATCDNVPYPTVVRQTIRFSQNGN